MTKAVILAIKDQSGKFGVVQECHVNKIRNSEFSSSISQYSLGKVCECLYGLGDEGEVSRCLFVGVLLREPEHARRQNGGAQEAQEDGRADQVIADVAFLTLVTALAETRKYLFKLTARDENTWSEELSFGLTKLIVMFWQKTHIGIFLGMFNHDPRNFK